MYHLSSLSILRLLRFVIFIKPILNRPSILIVFLKGALPYLPIYPSSFFNCAVIVFLDTCKFLMVLVEETFLYGATGTNNLTYSVHLAILIMPDILHVFELSVLYKHLTISVGLFVFHLTKIMAQVSTAIFPNMTRLPFIIYIFYRQAFIASEAYLLLVSV